MVVIGIDLGTQNLCVATPKVHSLDVVLNNASKRTSDAIMAYTDDDGRLFGVQARQRMKRNMKNTVTDLMRLLLRKWSDPQLHEEAKWWGPEPVRLEGDRVGFRVRHNGESVVLEGQQLLASYLCHVRDMAQADLKQPVNAFSIAIPSYFTNPQRREIQTACQILGVKLIHLTNQITAAALIFGVSAKEAETVLFMDMGACCTQVGAAKYYLPDGENEPKIVKKFDMIVQTVAEHGSRDIDRAMALTFAKEIQSKFGLDVTQRKSLKYMNTLLTYCSKLKKLLGMNKQASVVVDCFYDGQDYVMKMTREELEALTAPFAAGMMLPLQQALKQLAKMIADCHLSEKELTKIELIGGGIRVPFIKAMIQKVLNDNGFPAVKISTTLNGDETVAKGTALMGAMKSSAYRVRDFEYTEMSKNAISFLYNKNNTVQEKVIFKPKSKLPGCRVVKLHDSQIKQLIRPTSSNSGGITICFSSEEEKDALTLADNTGQTPICDVYINQSDIDMHQHGEKITKALAADQELVLMCRLDQDGTFGRLDAFITLLPEEEKEEMDVDKEEATASTDAKASDETKSDPAAAEQPAAAAADADAAAKTEAAPADAKKDAASPAKKKKKKKRKQVQIPLKTHYHSGMFTSLDKAKKCETNFQELDTLITKLADTKNTLETMIYDSKDKLADDYKEVVTAERAADYQQSIQTMGYWLDDEEYLDEIEGKPTKEACNLVLKLVNAKLADIKSMVDPLESLLKEKTNRPAAVAALKTHIGSTSGKAESIEWLTEEQKTKVAEKCSEVDNWLSNQLIEQAKLPAHTTPSLTLKMIASQRRALDAVCVPILATPKPAPPKPEPAKEEEAKKEAGAADAAKDAPADAAGGGDAEAPKDAAGPSADIPPPAGDAKPTSMVDELD